MISERKMNEFCCPSLLRMRETAAVIQFARRVLCFQHIHRLQWRFGVKYHTDCLQEEIHCLASTAEDAEKDIAGTTMGFYTIRRGGVEEPVDVGIVTEGIKVLSNIGSVILGFIMLFGLIYALDISFPDNLKYTFEFFQKIIMNLDGHKLNTKIQQLKIKLFA